MAPPLKRRALAVSAALVVVTFAAFSAVLGHGFLNFDDDTDFAQAQDNLRRAQEAAVPR